MSLAERQQAIAWYTQNVALSTIAQHFGLTVEQLKKQLRTTSRG